MENQDAKAQRLIDQIKMEGIADEKGECISTAKFYTL
jgi:hypothetical protein